MTPVLYHYVHCPFCVRVRMALGYLNLAYDSRVLAYDDEATPIGLTGVKILPVLTLGNKTINESLEIIALLDSDNRLKVAETTKDHSYFSLESLLTKIGSPVHSLAMPHWMWTPEFTKSSREYFQKKKEAKRGPFKDLVKERAKFESDLAPLLNEVEAKLTPFYQSHTLGLKDILIAAHVWGLYVVPEFQFSPKMHNYLQSVKAETRFNYHEDFWK